ncbi:MAG: acetolactate synthase large subunit [Parvularculaceae bacterium]
MNGAESLVRTLADAGVEVCFANPGTSEMQFVAALDAFDGVRPILALFEGVATGAADGYGRMAGKPAATLLHLGPGFGNGIANLHNARRARTPVVNIIGDHASYHLELDAPLTSDIVSLANPVSGWLRTCESADALAADGAAAVAASMAFPGEIATLIVSADFAWNESNGPAKPVAPAPAPEADPAAIDAVCAALKSGAPSTLILGGPALRADCLHEAGRIAAATGARLICETFPARIERGAGRVAVERLPYFGEMAAEYLNPFERLIMVGAKPPVSFFAYPGKPGRLTPEDADCLTLTTPRQDALSALGALADALAAPKEPALVQRAQSPEPPTGKLSAEGIGAIVGALLPENAIVSDEAATAGLALYPLTAGAPPHDWMTLTGGAIGQGLPLALGAAVACPDRKTVCLQADGSAMYTVQALWTMARENLDVTTVIVNNGSYAILNIELARVGVAAPGEKAKSLLDLTNPVIDWVSIAEGMGVEAARATTVEQFNREFETAMASRGPRLIEAVIA